MGAYIIRRTLRMAVILIFASIAVFYALGTALGGIAAPWIFGSLIGTGDPSSVAWGYAFGAVLMVSAAAVELWLGVAAERRSLEDVARPLSAVDASGNA